MDANTILKAADLLSKVKKELGDVYKFTKNELSTFFNTGVEKYLESQLEKHLYTKTFLYRDAPLYFYEVFFPLELRNNATGHVSKDTVELLEYNKYIAITGGAGCGKTMLMKHFFLNAYTALRKIPIVVELRNMGSTKLTLREYVYEVILENKILPADNIMKRLLENGRFMFLFDGYDELPFERKAEISAEITAFIDQYFNNSFVISSRPGANVEALPRFSTYHVGALTREEINTFVEQQSINFHDKALLKKIKNSINLPVNARYLSFLQNPLLLSMFILTFEYYPELPKSKSRFYFNVFDTLFTRHDSVKGGGFQHIRKSGLQREEIEQVLKWLALISFTDRRFSFELQYFYNVLERIRERLKLQFEIDDLVYDLTVSINILVEDAGYYSFPHRSQQEYFAALLLSQQTDEFKKAFYSKRMIALKENDLEHFWSLSEELDKAGFYNLYALPGVEKVIAVLGINRNKEDIAAYLFSLYEVNHENIFSGLAGKLQDQNGEVIAGLLLFITNEPILEKLLAMKINWLAADKGNRSRDYKKMFAETNIPDTAYQFYNKLVARVAEIKEELATEEAAKIDLLRI